MLRITTWISAPVLILLAAIALQMAQLAHDRKPEGAAMQWPPSSEQTLGQRSISRLGAGKSENWNQMVRTENGKKPSGFGGDWFLCKENLG